MLMPLTTRSGRISSAKRPTITASVGFPPTEYAVTPFSTIFVALIGSKMEIDRPTALCCVAGATMVTSTISESASYAAQSPFD